MRNWFLAICCVLCCASCTSHSDTTTITRETVTPGTTVTPDTTVTSAEGKSSSVKAIPDKAPTVATIKQAIANVVKNEAPSSDPKTETIEKRRSILPLQIKGRITPDFGKEVAVSPRVPGRIEQILVEPGEVVAVKQRLIIVDSHEITELEAELIEAQSKWKRAQVHLEREREILQDKINTPKALLEAKSEFQQAKIKKELSESQLHRVSKLVQEGIVAEKDLVAAKATLATDQSEFEERQSELRREENLYKHQGVLKEDFQLAQDAVTRDKQHMNTLYQRLKFLGTDKAKLDHILASKELDGSFTIHSPLAGVVNHYEVAVGQVVLRGNQLMKITDFSTVLVRANLPEAQVSLVKIGSRATITVAGYPNERFKGTINFISNHVDEKTRTVGICARLANPQRRFKTDMSAEIDLDVPEREYVACPRAAIHEHHGHSVVYVATAHGFEERFVTIGSVDQHYAEVLSGLKEGAKVATGSFTPKVEHAILHAHESKSEDASR